MQPENIKILIKISEQKTPHSRLLEQLENGCFLSAQFIFFWLVPVSVYEILLTAFNFTSRVWHQLFFFPFLQET